MAESKVVDRFIQYLEHLVKNSPSVRQIEQRAGISNGNLNKWIARDGSPSVENIEKIINAYPNVNGQWLLTGNGEMLADNTFNDDVIQIANVAEGPAPDLSKAIEYLKGSVIRPITVVVNPEGKEMISYVPIKAQAGYKRGFDDPEFMEKLPAFSLPALAKDATYRMFQVSGDSMTQLGGKGLRDGDIVIAQYVDDVISGVRDNRVYVIVGPEGVVIKRCINRLKFSDPILLLSSDNKNGLHKTKSLRPNEIKEVWEAKKVISSDFSFDTNLFQMLGDFQADMEILKEKVTKLEKK